MNNKLSHLVLSTGIAISCGWLAQAQDLPIPMGAPSASRQVAVVQSQESGVVVRSGGAGEMGFQFVGAEPAVSTQVVKGAPYSLEATVETEQTLGDGNRIVHRQAVHVYRDSEGRTRREETLAAIGPWAASGTPPTVVMIQDPVSGAGYSLDPQNKIATRLPKGLLGPVAVGAGTHVDGPSISIRVPPTGSQSAGPVTAFNSGPGVFVLQNGTAGSMAKPDEKSESLGEDVIAGISAEGTRLTMTIPAEAMGNERPIEITRERWYSSDLQIVLRSRQSDPRFGVTTYEVTKLDRSNPARSLFDVPRDYQIRKAPEPPLPPVPSK